MRLACPGVDLVLRTDRGVFSYGHVDAGSLLLIRAFAPAGARRVVDLGAGYGAVGLAIKARFPTLAVALVEINERAAALASENARRNALDVRVVLGDGLKAFGPRTVDAVVTNPPVRAGKNVLYSWIEQAATAVVPGGALWAVIRTKQGAESLTRAMARGAGPVEVVERGGGYRVLRALVVPPGSPGRTAPEA